MLTEICQELKNWFEKEKIIGNFKIEGGQITPPINLLNNQYYRIIGSVFNDGVHRHDHENLVDESFEGAIWLMAVPHDVIVLSEKIELYEESSTNTQFTSESFGGYSYTKATDASGNPITWETAFRKELNKWRKI